VDFRVTLRGEPFILETNTLPGMTETSLLPKAALAAGMDYDALVARIVRAALKKRGGA
jgi:D-alanine-D-alanine ligase